jgi:hypothetical protein
LPAKILATLENKVVTPQSFNQTWSFKNFWDTNFDYVLMHADKHFHPRELVIPEQKSSADFEYLLLVNPMGIG